MDAPIMTPFLRTSACLTGAFLIVVTTAKSWAPGQPAVAEARPYTSPYSVEFTYSPKDLIGDLLTGERGNPRRQAAVPFDEWYSAATRKKFGAWGPPAKTFDPPSGLDSKSAAWKRQRVLAIGLRYRGYSYQHHHLPDWDPPAGWPWKEVGHGRNAKGVDCSNFTGLVYNLALGVRFSTAIGPQSEATEVTTSGRTVRIQRIDRPRSYADCCKQFRTGDLLYIRNKAGRVSHVVLWVGDVGRAPAGTPLILDSTGGSRTDCNGRTIPDGVQLRPFTEDGWYHRSLAHAHRIIPD
jgi:cell wall-associated NlpC family hydrolase